MKFKDLLNEASSCPLVQPYGNMPTGGYYSNYTEYEIGAQRIAEALHCILGSLYKDYTIKIHRPYTIEVGHIKEEMKIIESVMKEYTRDIYTRQLSGGTYSQKSIDNMKKQSPKLIALSNKNMRNLKKEDMDTEMYNLAKSAYETTITLAQAVQTTFKYDDFFSNAFYNKKLVQSVKNLKKNVDIYIKTYTPKL